MERFGEVQGRFSQRHAVVGGPEVQDVAFGTAVGMKALEHVLFQVRRKRSMTVAWRGVNRTTAAPLRATRAQFSQAAQVDQYLLHADLATQSFELDLFVGTFAQDGGRGRGFVAWRCVDQRRRVDYLGVSRGDRLLVGLSFSIAARGVLFFSRRGFVPRVMLRIEGTIGVGKSSVVVPKKMSRTSDKVRPATTEPATLFHSAPSKMLRLAPSLPRFPATRPRPPSSQPPSMARGWAWKW